MNKNVKKSVILGAIFTAAMNMNGCVYGPPQESNLLNDLIDNKTTIVENTDVETESISLNLDNGDLA